MGAMCSADVYQAQPHTCADPAWCAGIGRLTAPTARFRVGEQWRPGSAITWSQLYPDYRLGPTERTGVVWEDAPLFDGAVRSVWVVPDRALTTDLYAVVAVGKASRSHDAHGTYGMVSGGWVSKGEIFASNLVSSPSGNLVARALQRTRREQP